MTATAREHLIDNLEDALHNIRFSKKRTLKDAQDALVAMKQLGMYNRYFMRGLVVFPDLLKECLQGCLDTEKYIEWDDFQSMICRCIEAPEDSEWSVLSCQYLLDYLSRLPTAQQNLLRNHNLLLMAERYEMNEDLLEKCRTAGLQDPYFSEATRPTKYAEPSLWDLDNQSRYAGYRHAYHLLLYGGERKKELLEWWTRVLRGSLDCSFEAACDFYGVPATSPMNIVADKINDKS